MSLVNENGPLTEIYSPLSCISVSSSLSDLIEENSTDVIVDKIRSIEELRQHMGSCFTCGVSWTDDHVSLDCRECGGYSVERPCPLCDGKCGVKWRRDFTMSHTSGKGRWVGVCPNYHESLNCSTTFGNATTRNTTTTGYGAGTATTHLRLAMELCARLEHLTTTPKIFSNQI